MALELRIIGDELFLEGTAVAHIYSSSSATLAQNLRDTLDGIELDTESSNGTLRQVEKAKAHFDLSQGRRKRFLVWARKQLKAWKKDNANLFRDYSAAVHERDAARQWAEKAVAEITVQRNHAYELGKEHQRRDRESQLQQERESCQAWREQAQTWEAHAKTLWNQSHGAR